ncbi:pyridoxamine 5'-phosphate oxidase [Paracoccus liaowanqingii]|uniref:Pyridoxamine 5'-phosphate oxidase n=1 Tax=Paracoccus liaowanqingii TaxID=2560053 RepID=A0A4P7HJI1_9RHOB|nr:pyridoxamine 5'-phosphate oxidase family protein [Paracoccus liaowanqingii]QBX34308.1 pyridoxamine 5'-phosphate oxidase [Paracoccus liaowanqingii]
MAGRTIQDLAKAMGKIDFAMLTTRTEGGQLATRPMSNKSEVEWDGDSYYFTYEDTRTVSDIERDRHVALSFQGRAGILGARPLFVAVEGEASIIRDKAAFADHWSADIDRWFPDGIDTPGMALVKVHAVRVHYWDGEEEGEVEPSKA